MGAIAVVAIIIVGAGAYIAGSGSKSTVTSTMVSTVTNTMASTVTTTAMSSSVITSVITSVMTGSGGLTTVTSTQTGSATTVTSVTTSVATQTNVTQPKLPTTLTATSSPLSEAGSSLLYPLFQFWAANFTQMYKNVQVNTAAGGSGTGLSDVEQNTINIGASDPFMTTAQSAAYPGILNIPVAVSSQAVNYNVPGIASTTHLNFTGNVLAGIYNGTITTWNNAAIQKLNPTVTLPSATIVPLHRSDSSGDTNLFTTYLSDTSPDWAKTYGAGNTVAWAAVPSAQAESGNSGMLTGAHQTQYCIAYIGVSYLAQATTDNLGNAALQNLAGNFVSSTSANIHSAVNAQYSATPPNEKASLIYGPGTSLVPDSELRVRPRLQTQPNTTTAQDIQALLGSSPPAVRPTGILPQQPGDRNLGFLAAKLHSPTKLGSDRTRSPARQECIIEAPATVHAVQTGYTGPSRRC